MNHAVGGLLGRLLANFNSRSKQISDVNLRICFPELNKFEHARLLKKSLQENSKTLFETLWLWRNASTAINGMRGQIVNEELLTFADEKPLGTIFVTPHFGSWEYTGLLTAAHCDLMILYVSPKIPYLHEFSRQGRSSTGATVVNVSTMNLKNIIKHLNSGGSIGVLPDQVPPGNGGIYSPFFNRLAYTSVFVSKLARKIRCDVVFCYSVRRHEFPIKYDTFYYSAPKDIYSSDESKSVRVINNFIEECVTQQPEQYLWGYKRFKRPSPTDSNPY